MDAIKYLDADTILDYLHNSSETYLEGLIPQSHGFPPETDRSVYVRLLKVPVRDKASEVYMQAIPYKMFEGLKFKQAILRRLKLDVTLLMTYLIN